MASGKNAPWGGFEKITLFRNQKMCFVTVAGAANDVCETFFIDFGCLNQFTMPSNRVHLPGNWKLLDFKKSLLRSDQIWPFQLCFRFSSFGDSQNAFAWWQTGSEVAQHVDANTNTTQFDRMIKNCQYNCFNTVATLSQYQYWHCYCYETSMSCTFCAMSTFVS